MKSTRYARPCGRCYDRLPQQYPYWDWRHILSTTVLITHDTEATALLHWAGHFARGLGSDIVVVNPVRGKDGEKVEEIDLALETDSSLISAIRQAARDIDFAPAPVTQEESGDQAAEDRPPAIRVIRVTTVDIVEAVLQQLGAARAELLLIPRHVKATSGNEYSIESELAARAPCATVLLRPGAGNAAQCRRMLVAVSGGQHATAALRLAHGMCTAADGELTALYVEPPVGDDAELVGERILDRVVSRALGAAASSVKHKIVLGKNILQGITEACSEQDDIVLVGATGHGAVRKLLFSRISDKLLAQDTVSAVAVVRAAIPLRSRFQNALDRRVRSIVPQVNRGDRVALTEKIQSSSQSDFDFIALMCLSTLIAALGLVNNASAVIIGAMLVAPLMTPLLGMGLAIVQGNKYLLRLAAQTVGVGFFVALFVGLVTGFLVGDATLTSEMAARCEPGRLDLLVATASGLAAAYAISRPNLLSALPGVAIAAALVPPIATTGLALATGQFRDAGGAALLFLTNIVAIILATAISFWAVGIRSAQSRTTTQRAGPGVSPLFW